MSKQQKPLLHRFFSWIAIGLIIYVLFFNDDGQQLGTKVAEEDEKGNGGNIAYCGLTEPNINTEPDINSQRLPRDHLGIKIYDDKIGEGKRIYCSEEAVINYKIWDLQGNLVASTFVEVEEEEQAGSAEGENLISTPVIFELGKGQAPYVFTAGIIGDGFTNNSMKRGGRRTIIAPAHLMKQLNSDSFPEFILPAKIPEGIAVMELELLGD